MTSLPYWDTGVDMRIAPWFPLGVDYGPISVNHHHSGRLSSIAASALCLNSEFLCLTSLQSGYTGTLLRDNMFLPGKQNRIDFGFTMIFGYSPAMENAVASLMEGRDDIEGGVSFCTLWNGEFILESFKAIMLVSGNPFFGEDDFLEDLDGALEKVTVPSQANMPFFAEKFGYKRFFIPYETDDPVSLEISRLLHEMEFEETRKWVGPSPEISFPALLSLQIETD